MDTNTFLGFVGVVALLLLWSWYAKQRGFGGGFVSALLTLAVLVGIGLLVMRFLRP